MAEVEQERLLGYETQWKQEDIDTRRDPVNERSCTWQESQRQQHNRQSVSRLFQRLTPGQEYEPVVYLWAGTPQAAEGAGDMRPHPPY